MRTIIVCLLCISFFSSYSQSVNSLSLMPVPASVSIQNGKYVLTPQLTVSVQADPTDTTLLRAANRMFQTLNRRTGLYFRQEYVRSSQHADTANLSVVVKQKTAAGIGVDESYQLKVSEKNIKLEANTTIGALRGMETLLQLQALDSTGFYLPQVRIEDAPRFKWRGLMIDVSRHFIPMEIIKRNIEAMSAVKMNVLHLHLSDDQGFRIESRKFPLLQAKGSNGKYYTQLQMKELIGFAADRGIIIVPEFDMPGHASSWFAGYPGLATKEGIYAPGSPYKIDRSQPVSPAKLMQAIQSTPFPTFHPVKDYVYDFLDGFIGEMCALFPSPYFHIGADENNGVAWKQDSAIAQFMRKNNFKTTHELQAYFVNRVQKIVTKYGKKTVGWDELFSKNLPKDVVVQVWQPMSQPSLPMEIIAQGNPVIISKGLYLDLFMPAYIHYKVEFPSEQILGGEGAQWTEIADAENIETRMWPRAAAIAERFWSPKSIRDSIDMYRRLFLLSDRLTESGLQHMTNYDRMVLRFSNGYNYQATRTLLDVLTPVRGYKRLFNFITLPESAMYPTAPFFRAADISQPDSRVKWTFRKNVVDFLETKNPIAEKAIRDQLTIWSVNRDQMSGLFKAAPLAGEVAEHSGNLSLLSKAALETLEMTKTGKQPDIQWMTDHEKIITSGKGVYGETDLSVYPELLALITGKLSAMPDSFPIF